MKKIFFIVFVVLCSFSCTSNQRSRHFGQDLTIELPKGQKLINATWKDNNLYYLLEPMEENYAPKIKTFIESSSWGIFEAQITFIEKR